jgi:hypothetical protein
MATLTETAYYTRQTLKFGILAIVVLLVLKLGFTLWSTYLRVVKPEPPPPPTVSFGKLPSIKFPEKTHPELTLRLETPTGGTPDLGDRAEVFLMPVARSNFLALDQAKETARKIGFKDEPKEITARRFRWEDNQFLPSTLEMDIINGSFVLQRNWQADPTTLTEKQLPGREQAVVEAKQFLRQAGLLSKELEQARTEIVYLTFSAGQYTKTVSLSEADFVEVDLFRPNIKEKPVLPVDPNKGIVRIIFSGAREAQKKVVWAEYNYFPVDTEQSATYPIKTASQAWRELQTRQGYIAATGQNPKGVITIRRIYLGYYDNTTPQGFLLPIIVFEGDNGFFGYVGAITDQWVEKALPSEN